MLQVSLLSGEPDDGRLAVSGAACVMAFERVRSPCDLINEPLRDARGAVKDGRSPPETARAQRASLTVAEPIAIGASVTSPMAINDAASNAISRRAS
jgi:hypothetical protein